MRVSRVVSVCYAKLLKNLQNLPCKNPNAQRKNELTGMCEGNDFLSTMNHRLIKSHYRDMEKVHFYYEKLFSAFQSQAVT